MIKGLKKVLYSQVVQFYIETKHLYNNRVEFARAFLKTIPCDLTEQSIARYYFEAAIQEDIAGTLKIDKKDTLDAIKEELNVEQESTTVVESEGEKKIEYHGQKQITSLEEAIAFFEIDTTVWNVETWKCKSWDTSMKLVEVRDGVKVSTPITRTNYLVSVHLKKKLYEIDYEKIYEYANEWIVKKKISEVKGKGVGVLTIADLHAGLSVTPGKDGVIKLPTYNLQKLIEYLEEISSKVNSLEYNELHLICLGDLFESITGFNHTETLKDLEKGQWSGNIIITVYEILVKFIQSLNNVKQLFMISGNHDRFTPIQSMDKDGGGAQVVSYFLSKTLPTIWHPLLINTVIDNISYIMTHGHLNLAKGDIGKIVLEYGIQSKFNVLLDAHIHHRKSVKLLRQNDQIKVDTTKYRAITVPAIMTGNRWSEESGFGAPPGYTVIEANSSKNNINHFDFSL